MVYSLWPPLSVIPSWPKANYIDPENRGYGLVYCGIILGSLGILVLVARLYSRFAITRAAGIDDLLIVIAGALAVVLTVLVLIGNQKYHSGYHIWDIPVHTAVGHRKNVYASQWCYLWSTGFIKVSVLLFYRRLSVSFNRVFYWAVWAGIIYNILQLVAFSVALLAICKPISAYWMSFDLVWLYNHGGDRHCVYEGYSLTASGIVSVIGDFYAALLPSLLILRLQMPANKKMVLIGLFAFGYAVVVVGVGRTVMLSRVVFHDYDYTWILWDYWMWSLVELWAGLIAASAPALKPLIVRYVVEPLSTAVRSANYKVSHKASPEPRSITDPDSTPLRVVPGVKSSRDRSNSDKPSTELSFITEANTSAWPAGEQDDESVDWPLSNDVQRSDPLRSHPTTPALPPTYTSEIRPLEFNNYEYRGNGRCWSAANDAVSPALTNNNRDLSRSISQRELLGSKSKRGSSNKAEALTHRHTLSARRVVTDHRDHRGQHSADLIENKVVPETRPPTAVVGQIDRTVEWSVLKGHESESRKPSSRAVPYAAPALSSPPLRDVMGRPATRSIVDLEKRVGQFASN